MKPAIFIVDATPLHFAGGRIVLDSFLNGLKQMPLDEMRFHFFCHPRYDCSDAPQQVFLHKAKNKAAHALARLFLSACGFLMLCLFYRCKGHKVYFLSLANMPALMWRLQRQVVLVHQAHAMPAGAQWRAQYGNHMPWRRRFELKILGLLLKVLALCERVTVVVQTQFMVAQVRELLGAVFDVRLVRQGVTLPYFDEKPRDVMHKKMNLFALTRGYPHKHLEQIVDLCKHIDAGELPLEVKTTLGDEAYEQHIKQLLSNFRSWHNIGPQTHQQALKTLATVDALLWTSKLESLGLPIVEAMALGIPVLVIEDSEIARELLGEFYMRFTPTELNQSTLTDLLQKLRNPALREGLQRRATTLIHTPKAYANEMLDVIVKPK